MLKTIGLLIALSLSLTVQARTEIQLLYGSGFNNPGNPHSLEKSIVSLHHSSHYDLFKTYFFIDGYQQNGPADPLYSDPDASGFYGEYYQNFSVSKWAGWSLGDNVIKGVNLTAAVNYGRHDGPNQPVSRVWLYGGSVDVKLPKGFLNVALLAYDDHSYSDSGATDSKLTYQITPAWNYPFYVANARFEFAGYVDFIGRKASGKVPYTGGQIQLRYDIGHPYGKEGKAFIGVEYHFFNNKFGIEGLNEEIPQAMIAWVF